MNHKEIKELLPLYIDGGTTEEESEEIRQHLTNCEICSQEVKDYKANYRLLKNNSQIESPEGLYQKIIANTVGKPNDQKQTSWIDKIKKLFNYNLNLKAGYLVTTATLLLIITVFSLGNFFINNNYNGYQDEIYQDNYMVQEQAVPDRLQIYGIGEAQEDLLQKSAPFAENDTTIPERKIIKTGYIKVEVKDIANVENLIMELVNKYQGYIANSNSWVRNEQDFSRYQLRIPADKFDLAYNSIINNELGKVLSHSMSGNDITEEYMDLDIRINNLNAQEVRYRDLLNKAENVEDILKIEKELDRVRTEIERLQGRMNYLNNRINMSTIDVEFQEIEPLSSTGQDFFEIIRRAVREMVQTVNSMIITLAKLLPYILLILIGYLVYKRKNHKK